MGSFEELRFGECVVHLASRRVHRCDQPVHLSRKAYELLVLLLGQRPRVLSKAELLERLWPDTFVVEANLSNLVSEVRSALGDDPRRPALLRTVHGVGYAFAGAIEQAVAVGAGSCWLLCGRRRIPLGDGDHIIGRSPQSVVPIDSALVSRHHARIRLAGGRATLVDLNSKNGTYLRGTRIESPVPLEDCDVIRVGPLFVRFRTLRSTASTATQAPAARRATKGRRRRLVRRGRRPPSAE